MTKSLEHKIYGRSRSVGQCGCRVGTSRRSHMQGLMVVGFIVEILGVGFKNDSH